MTPKSKSPRLTGRTSYGTLGSHPSGLDIEEDSSSNVSSSVANTSLLTQLERLRSFDSSATLGFDIVETATATSKNNRKSNLTGEITPLPMKIMVVLCIIIFCEPMSMTILFPFVYFMVRDFGFSNEKEIGYYVGFIASAFSFAQFLTSILWGWTSDRIGRRPVLLLGLLGNAISLLMFGQSHSLWWAIMSRGLCGFLNGNIGVAKSLLGEITDSTNQARGFSAIGLMWAIGMIVGPILGGMLADPVKNFPQYFGGIEFLERNPYFFPCFVSACISLVGFVIGFFYLEETAHSVRKGKQREDVAANPSETTPLISASPTCSDELRDSVATAVDPESSMGSVPPKSMISSTSVRTIIGYGMLAFQNVIFDEIFSLWSVTPPKDGFQSVDIGLSLSIMGCVTLFMQLIVYPYLSRFYTALDLYRFGIRMYTVLFLGFPCISTFVAPSQEPWLHNLVWPLFLSNLAIRHTCNVLTFTSVMIMINNSAERGNLGIVNGVGQTCAALVRSIGPALGGIAWAGSISSGNPFPFNHWFVFLFLSIFATGTFIQSHWIPDSVGRLMHDEDGDIQFQAQH